MRSPSTRSTLLSGFLSGLALGAAVLAGTRECFALLRARLGGRLRVGRGAA